MTRITGTLHEDQNTFLFIFRSVLTRIWTVSNKSRRENQNKHLKFSNCFFENRTEYEIMCENTAEQSRPQMTIQHMRIACWIPKATNTHSEYAIFIFLCNKRCMNAPHFYVTLLGLSCVPLFTCTLHLTDCLCQKSFVENVLM
jgi:hypothetical protein